MNNQIQAFENSEFGRLDVLMIEARSTSRRRSAPGCWAMLCRTRPLGIIAGTV